MDRYQLPAPPAGHQQDLEAWKQCIDNSCSQLEHQAIRLENLGLLEEYQKLVKISIQMFFFFKYFQFLLSLWLRRLSSKQRIPPKVIKRTKRNP